MTRKEFLQTIWKYLLRPLVWAAVVYVCVNFVAAAISQNGNERLLWYMGLAGAALLMVLGLLQWVLAKAVAYIHPRISGRVQRYLRIVLKTIGFVLPFMLGALLYHGWLQDPMLTLFFMLLLLVSGIQHILREEKAKNGPKT